MDIPGFRSKRGFMSQRIRKKSFLSKDVLLMLAILLGVGILVGAAALYVSKRTDLRGVCPGVTIAGEDVGGLDENMLRESVQAHADELAASRTLRITVDDTVYTMKPSDAGAYWDVERAVTEAWRIGRTGDMLARLGEIRRCAKGYDITLSFVYTEQELAEYARRLSTLVAIDYRDSSYTVEDDRVVLDTGSAGRFIDETKLLRLLSARYRADDMSDIVLTSEYIEPEPLDLSALEQMLDVPAQDAYWLPGDRTFETAVADIAGVDFDPDEATRILKGEGGGMYGTRYEVPLHVVEPAVTVAQLSESLFRDVLCEQKTLLKPLHEGRTNNVRIACEKVNGTLLLPGETFSFNTVVGKRTYEAGFMDAPIFDTGELVDGIGGGICQVSSMLYMAAVRADLQINERHYHQFVVNYAPPGEDATVYYGKLDFRFTNSTDYPLLIECRIEDDVVTVRLMGTNVHPERTVDVVTKTLEMIYAETKEEYDATKPRGYRKQIKVGKVGYRTETYRVIYENGEEISRTLENKSYYNSAPNVWVVG